MPPSGVGGWGKHPAGTSPGRGPYVACLLLAVACVYGAALDSGFVNYDDLAQIVQNRLVTAPAEAPLERLLLTPSHGYIVPVTLLTQSVLWWLGHGHAWVFHVFGLTVHAGLSLALFLTLDRVAPRARAFAGALIFALHPVCVEPVLWATGIKDLLAATLSFVATVAFVRFASRQSPSLSQGALAVVAAAMAMLSKPTAALLGLAWLAFLLSRRRAPERGAWTVAGAASVLGLLIGVSSRLTHDALIAREPIEWRWPLPLSVLGRQALHLVWPVDLHPSYQIDPGRVDAHTVLGLFVTAGLVAALFRLRHAPLPLLCVAAAIATYLPVSDVLPFARRMSDSYLYSPLAALVACAVLALGPGTSRRTSRVLGNLGLVAAVGLGIAARHQTRRWHDSVSLWTDAVASMPEFDTALGGLASARALRGEYLTAVLLYERAFARAYRGDLVDDFAVTLANAGRLDDAECAMIEGALTGPSGLKALRNYAVLLARNPGRPLRYPEVAAYLLPTAIYGAESGGISLDARSIARLEARWRSEAPPSSWKGVPSAPQWARGTCDVLRPHRQSP